MADRMAAEIRIGGKVPRSLVDALCAAIRSENAALEWGGGHFAPADAQELMQARDGEHLCLRDDQAAWGELDELEEFLREHHIAFDRRSEGKYEYDPERVTYRPDRGVEVCLTTESGNPIVEVASLQPVLQALDALCERLRQGKMTRGSVLRRMERLRELFRSTLPSEPPPLEPFTIEEDQ